jgi:hypothetical protein
VHDNGEEGICIKYGSSTGTVSRNTLYNNGSLRAAPQIYIDAAYDIDVAFNECYAGFHAGIGLAVETNAGEDSLSGVACRNNLVYQNKGAGFVIYIQDPAAAYAVLSANIYNNVIYGNATVSNWGGIYDLGAGKTTDNYGTVNVKNNVIYGNASLGGSKEIRDDSNAMGGWNITHNLFKLSATNDRPGTDSVTTSDPIFTDAANGDFTLASNSPCINAGTDVGLTTDFAGNPIVGNPDIGAYEYQP